LVFSSENFYLVTTFCKGQEHLHVLFSFLAYLKTIPSLNKSGDFTYPKHESNRPTGRFFCYFWSIKPPGLGFLW